jgi:predicted ABC-type ATPase
VPALILLAGPNGAGKTTASEALLRDELRVDEFVNADAIAQGLSAFRPEKAAMEAGRVMLQRLHHLTEQRANVAFESTLASRTFAPWIRGLLQTGYEFHLCYFWLPSADVSVERVQRRVRLGGHNVPEETIRRRYEAGLRNFFELYSPIASTWRFYDNNQNSGPRLVSDRRYDLGEYIYDESLWRTIKERYQHG